LLLRENREGPILPSPAKGTRRGFGKKTVARKVRKILGEEVASLK